MRNSIILVAALIIMSGCMAEKSVSKTKEVQRTQYAKSSISKVYTPKNEIIEYVGNNHKSSVVYNVNRSIFTYSIKSAGRKQTIKLSGLAGLIDINGNLYYTDYRSDKIKTTNCIYDAGTRNIVINSNSECVVEMYIKIDNMPKIENIKSITYISDLGSIPLKQIIR